MSLDLPTLAPQLSDAGQSAVQERQRYGQILPKAQRALETAASMDPAEMEQRLQRTGSRWSGAIPTTESIGATFQAPTISHTYSLIAADGSQIYPDRHAPAQYYLINTGAITLTPGSGQAPSVSSTPQLFHRPQELVDEFGSPLSSEYINGQRDVAEMAELARLASQAQEKACLALLDNGLLLWLMLQVRDQPKAGAEALIEAYLGHMNALRDRSAALAGVMDRPRHSNLLALAHLAQLPLESINDDALRANPFAGLSDAGLLMGMLAVGERSALFRYASPVNERFRQAGHEIHFFYLRTSVQVLLRVEIPAWLAADPELVGLVHAGILADSTATGGFPYTLARAHELAVVSAREKNKLDELLAAELARQGLNPRLSAKSNLKTWLGGQRSHRL